MIVPMKKVSLIIKGNEKSKVLKKLRKLGVLHIEIKEGSGEKLEKLKSQTALLEGAVFSLGKSKDIKEKKADAAKALEIAEEVFTLEEQKKEYFSEKAFLNAELERIKSWGDIEPEKVLDLSKNGVEILPFEMPASEYEKLAEKVNTLPLCKTKSSVKFLIIKSGAEGEEKIINSAEGYKFKLPETSNSRMESRISELNGLIKETNEKLICYSAYTKSLKAAVKTFEKEIEFETYATGMADENLGANGAENLSIAYFTGYIEADNTKKLSKIAEENAWGLVIEEPSKEDDVPTKLKNNKFVSLIYPLTDFLGTVPGYFEYDISGWFLGFILIFFGIIFGDGGYGLLICSAAAVPIIKSFISKKKVSPAFLLVGLFGISTVIWGTVTCTWFGMPPESLPQWLKSLSIPFISNVYGDKIWHPFWVQGDVGLTTAQNLQIFCFSLALIQLTVAHIKVAARDKKSIKILGDIGAILELLGIYYLVLSLVVNQQVFSFGLKIAGIPVGTVSIALIGIGFVLNFVFSNYEGSIVKSILTSCTNIVSVLLGVVNVFSDIVSYIRLWAVGLAGAAISATVNELAGPLFGNFMFSILAIFLLVFGHGLNMVLNVLSVIVHGIRLNTLEFSSHLDMSWSGHKFKPFEE